MTETSVSTLFHDTTTVFFHWKDLSQDKLDWLNSQIEVVKSVRKNVNISNLVGSGAGITGGVLAVVGTALIPFTFGVSTILIATGLGISVPGALVTVGSSITESVISKKIKEDEETIRVFEETNEKLDKMLQELETTVDRPEFLKLFSSSHVNLLHEILSGLSLLRGVGLIASFTEDMARVVFVGNIAVARTIGVVAGSIAGGVGLAFDFANIGFTLRNMIGQNNSTKKSEEMESIVQRIMLKKRLVGRLLERLEFELYPARFCMTCYDKIDEFNIIRCSHDHGLCPNCFVTYCRVLISEGKGMVTCPVSGCESLYDRKVLELYLDTEEIRKWDQVLYRKAIFESSESIDLLVWCRFCGSPYQLKNARKANDTLFECKNPKCCQLFCVNPDCNVIATSHATLTCEEAKNREDPDEILRREIEEKITQIKVRTCAYCTKECQKIAGCNFVKCDCGVAMCYLCRQSNITYNHFHNNHDNGCPSSDCSKCLLHEDPNVIDDGRIIALFETLEENGVPEHIIENFRSQVAGDLFFEIIQ